MPRRLIPLTLAAAALLSAGPLAAPASAIRSPATPAATTPAPVAVRADRDSGGGHEREGVRDRPSATSPTGSATEADPFAGMDTGNLAPIAGAGTSGSEQVPGTPGGRGDWLATNGLKSPSCRGSRTPSCLDSGTRSIPVPPGYYDLDTWMESGTLGLPKWSNLLAELTAFVWSLIVAITAAMFAALEWALGLDLLLAGDGALARLQVLEGSWGMPLAAVLLGIGVMWVAVQSIFPKRIGAALSNAWLGLLVAGISMAILSNPAGTIGELGRYSGDLGREAAAMPLKIVDRGETLDGGLSRMWEASIERPWSLLEFGDVKWGTRASQLDPRLAKEARRIAATGGEHKVRRAAQANTNARMTLLWEANSDQRNNRDDEGCDGGPCLLRVMCGTDDMDKCEGPLARYVQPRTEQGVRDRALQVFVIGLGMLSMWIILAAIVFGLLWSAITSVMTLIELAYTWPLAMTFKPEWRKKVTEQVMRLVGAALAYVVFGIAAGIMMTLFMLTQRVPEGWLAQWALSIVAMVVLWTRRTKVKDLLATLTSGAKTADAAGGFASRLASSYATGVGLGAIRGSAGGAMKLPGMPRHGAGGSGGGGGLPDKLPGDGAGSGGPGRRVLAAGVIAGGIVGGPAGSAAALAALQRGAISDRAGAVAGRVKRGLDASAGGQPATTNGSGRVVGPGGVVAPGKQAGALLAGQRAARTAEAAKAREQLPAARQTLRDAEQQTKAAKLLLGSHKVEGGPGWQGAVERVEAAEEARAAAAGAVDALEHVEQAGSNTDSWVSPAGDGFTEQATGRADAWLDRQSELPQHSRSYRQLAAMHGITPAAWSTMEEDARERVKVAIDASLTTRAAENVLPPKRTALQALGAVAGAQHWRTPR